MPEMASPVADWGALSTGPLSQQAEAAGRGSRQRQQADARDIEPQHAPETGRPGMFRGTVPRDTLRASRPIGFAKALID
ncbi:hypothetical protein E4U53_005429 [Claviceps sorghi]|nr:hypothetical protein E4U53_005429 [Claviceps sorghi]